MPLQVGGCIRVNENWIDRLIAGQMTDTSTDSLLFSASEVRTVLARLLILCVPL